MSSRDQDTGSNAPLSDEELTEFRNAMEEANLLALREQDIWTSLAPEPPHIWRWEIIDPLIDAAARAAMSETAEPAP